MRVCAVMRPCESCKEPYSARPLSRFCSSPCRQWAYRNRVAAAARPTTAAPVPVVLAPDEHLRYAWLPWREAADKCFSWSNRDAILALPERIARA